MVVMFMYRAFSPFTLVFGAHTGTYVTGWYVPGFQPWVSLWN